MQIWINIMYIAKFHCVYGKRTYGMDGAVSCSRLQSWSKRINISPCSSPCFTEDLQPRNSCQ